MAIQLIVRISLNCINRYGIRETAIRSGIGLSVR